MKYINTIIIVVFLLLLSGCKKEYESIPLIIYNQEDPYIANFEETIVEKSNGLFSIVSFDSQNSQLIQNEIIDELISKHPKVIIVNPVDRLGAYTIIEKAKQEGVPVIFFNREPLEEDLSDWNYAVYVGALDEQSAVIQADMVKELFGLPMNLSELDLNEDNKIQVVILKGEQGHQAAEKRTAKVILELEEYGYVLEILAIEVCDWERDNAFEFMSDFAPLYKDQIELVLSNNDAMSLGAIDALVDNGVFEDINLDGIYERNVDGWIPVIGIDGLVEAKPYLLDKSLYGTVLNDSDTMASAIVELAQAIINGDDPNDISFEVINNNYIWVSYKRYELDED